MAIPGLKPKLDVRAKVRIGEKRVSKGGKDYPAATDYFLSDDPEFQKLYSGKPRVIRVVPAYDDPSEFFSTGLEWWIKDKNKNPLLACYTKDAGERPVALRMEGMKDPENEVVGEMRGNNKLPILCAGRECRQFKNRNCRPMARLTFFLEGGRTDQALQLDTKSWNSIEAIEGALRSYTEAPEFRHFVFELSVRIETQGDKRFPVLSIQEVDVKINTDEDVTEGDALLTLSNNQTREGLFDYLNETRLGWQNDDRYVERIKEVGVAQAIASILKRMED